MSGLGLRNGSLDRDRLERTLNSLWSLRYPSPEHEENCSIYHGDWRSLVAHSLWERRVVGSNPTSPTNFIIKEHYEF